MGANRAPGQNQQHLKVQGLRGPVCCVWRKPPLKTSHTDAPRSEKTPRAETRQKTHTNCGGRLILEEHTQQCSTDVMQHVRRTLQASRLALMELHSFGHMPAQNKTNPPVRPKGPSSQNPHAEPGLFLSPKDPEIKGRPASIGKTKGQGGFWAGEFPKSRMLLLGHAWNQ